jgi:tetratricopeptide (TPR) repeat protein
MLWGIFIVLAAAIASYFVPTATVLQDAFKSGQNFFAARDYKKAIQQYDAILSTDSEFLSEDSVRVELLNKEFIVGVRTAAYYQRANAYKNLKQFDSALANFRIVVNERKDSPKLSALAQYQIYDMFYRNQNYASATVEAWQLIRQFPWSDKVDRAYYDLGWTYRELGEHDSSNLAFRYLVDHFDSSEYRARSLYQIAQNDFDNGEWADARKTYQEMAEKYKPSSFAQKEFENVELRALKERRIFEAATEREGETSNLELVAKAEVKIGDCYDKLNDYDNAMLAYRHVATTYSLIPTLVEVAYIKTADMTVRVKGLEEGLTLLRRAIDENFQDKALQAKLQYKIAKTLQDQKQYARAADEYRFYTKGYATVADAIEFPVERANYVIVYCYYSAKEYANAVAEADSFTTKYTASEYLPDVTMLKGLSLSNLKQSVQSRSVFERIVQTYSKSNQYLPAKMQIGQTYYEEKNYEEAIKAYQRVLVEDSERADRS